MTRRVGRNGGGKPESFSAHTDRHCYTGASSPHTVQLCLGVMGPSIEVLCVASQVVCTLARET